MLMRFIVLFLTTCATIQSYEPLNLAPPPSSLVVNDYETSDAESFALCDLTKDLYKSYCQNNGICYTIVRESEKQVAKKTNNVVDREIFCSCPLEFTGLRCETKLATSNNSIY